MSHRGYYSRSHFASADHPVSCHHVESVNHVGSADLLSYLSGIPSFLQLFMHTLIRLLGLS